MSLFEIIHGYKPRKPLHLFLMSLHARVSESVESFTHKIQDLHVEITKQLQASNAHYKM
jgi:hypothetical protein